jgi:uncharacterized YkwD family protein
MKKKYLALVLPLIFTVSCAQQKQQAQQPLAGVESSMFETGQIKNVKITADKADLRLGCSTDAAVLQSLSKDNTFNVIGQVSDWYALKLPNNKIGFIAKDQCKPVVTASKAVIPQAAAAPTAQGTTVPKTPSAKTNASTLTSAEQQMVNLVNQARAQNNVPALKVDMQVTNVARIKAQDMIDNKYFSHYSPKYGSPFDMMKAFAINYVQAGENIAGNGNVQAAENALMNSPGHRKNILNPEYTHIGIGIKVGGPYGNMISQMFVSKPQ